MELDFRFTKVNRSFCDLDTSGLFLLEIWQDLLILKYTKLATVKISTSSLFFAAQKGDLFWISPSVPLCLCAEISHWTHTWAYFIASSLANTLQFSNFFSFAVFVSLLSSCLWSVFILQGLMLCAVCSLAFSHVTLQPWWTTISDRPLKSVSFPQLNF